MAARFWVGGTGTWDASDTTHWASSSGGAGGQSVPGSGDTVTFDGSSGGGTVTVGYDPSVTSITGGAFTGTLDFGTSNPTMQTFSFSGTGTRTLIYGSGNWTVSGNAGTVWTTQTTTNMTTTVGTATINFTYAGSTGTRTIIAGAEMPNLSVSAGSDVLALGSTLTCANFNLTGFTGNWNTTTTLTCKGSFTLGSGMTVTTQTGVISMTATSGTKVFTSNGVVLNRPLTINGSGGTFQFADTLDLNGQALTFTNGTLDATSRTLNIGTFSCNDNNTKTLTITNSTINITSTATGTQFNVANGSGGIPTNLTVNATGSTINFTGSTLGTTASHTFSGGGKTWGNLVYNGPMRPSISFSNTFANLTIIGTTGTENRFTCAVDQTVTGTTTITGTATKRVLVIGAGTGSEGTQRTITSAVVAFSYVDFQDMRISGAASPATGTSLGDCFNNTNITTDTPRTLYWVGNAGTWSDTAHWSLTSGGAGGQPAPLPQDTVYFDANSITLAGQTITEDVCRPGKNVDFSAVLNAPTLAMRSSNVQGTTFYGDLIFAPTMTVTGSDSVDLANRTTANWNPAGITFPNSWVIRAANGGIITQLGNFISSGATGLSLSLGKLVVNGYNNRTNTFVCNTFTTGSGRNQALDIGSGTWQLTDNGTTTVWNITSTGVVITPGTGVLKLTGTSANTRTFAGGTANSYPTLLISGTGSGKTVITGNNTFAAIVDDNITTAHTVEFAASVTQTVAPGGWGINGSPSVTISIQSSSAGTPFTVSVASGLVRAQYLSIKDSTATGGAYFQAVNSTNVSGNTGWNFATASAGGGLQAGKKFAAFGGARPINKVLDSKLHGYRKLGG